MARRSSSTKPEEAADVASPERIRSLVEGMRTDNIPSLNPTGVGSLAKPPALPNLPQPASPQPAAPQLPALGALPTLPPTPTKTNGASDDTSLRLMIGGFYADLQALVRESEAKVGELLEKHLTHLSAKLDALQVNFTRVNERVDVLAVEMDKGFKSLASSAPATKPKKEKETKEAPAPEPEPEETTPAYPEGLDDPTLSAAAINFLQINKEHPLSLITETLAGHMAANVPGLTPENVVAFYQAKGLVGPEGQIL